MKGINPETLEETLLPVPDHLAAPRHLGQHKRSARVAGFNMLNCGTAAFPRLLYDYRRLFDFASK
jgi:hypothetical protein